MTSSSGPLGGPTPAPMSQNACPRWCVTRHGLHLGEEDWVHTSAPVSIADGLVALLCMSRDPAGRAEDGPYVLIGTTEYTVAEAKTLGHCLIALTNADM